MVAHASRACHPRTEGDRCPGVLRLHDALDGALARVRVPGGRMSDAQLVALARGARLGSGIVEITSRANVQLRGLTKRAGEELAVVLMEAGLLPSPEHERARNILASPVAGRHPKAAGDPGDTGGHLATSEIDDLVAALDRGLCADPSLAGLPGRFSLLVEDGSGLLRGHDHDVALLVASHTAGARATLALAGRATGLRAPLRRAAELALEAARAFLAVRGTTNAWRIRELAGGAEAVAARLGAGLAPAASGDRRPGPAGPEALPLQPGRLRQRDGRIAITALPPLARLDPTQLDRLAALASRCGAEARFSPWRTVTLVDVPDGEAGEVERELGDLGLVLDRASGWQGLSACAGLGGCRRARDDVRALAATRADQRAPGAPAEHWTACERRCGERAEVPIAISIDAEAVEVRLGGNLRRVGGTEEALALLAGEPSGEGGA